ncbi:MAG TPA: hypothetical protein VE054_04435 [Blattabacteriaceae bacterium]|nr:hypothetical protein [Blattabacteriaceae bacterium]
MGALNRTLLRTDQSLDQELPTPVNDKQKVFVVEDDADIARLVRHHLEAAGYRTRVYATAHAVLADALRDRPALLLLDIMVPAETESNSAVRYVSREKRSALRPLYL